MTLLPPFITPVGGRLIQFKNDNELEMFNFKSRVVGKNYKNGALPSTVILTGKPDFISLTREWQELWFEAIKWQAGGRYTQEQLLDIWKSVTMHSRAFTDRHSWDYPNEYRGVHYNGFRDYILGINILSRDISQRRLSCSGNIAVMISGGNKVAFKALDLSNKAPIIDKIWGNHTLIWWATESDRPNWYDGGRKDITGRWPQLGELGVPFLNISPRGINYVSNNRVRKIVGNTLFSPYTI